MKIKFGTQLDDRVYEQLKITAARERRPIAEIVEELDAIEAEAKETDKALRNILKQLGV